MTHREKSFFNIAKQMCRLSNFDRARVGAVVVSGKRILSASCNSTKTRPLQFYYNKYRNFEDYPNNFIFVEKTDVEDVEFRQFST